MEVEGDSECAAVTVWPLAIAIEHLNDLDRELAELSKKNWREAD